MNHSFCFGGADLHCHECQSAPREVRSVWEITAAGQSPVAHVLVGQIPQADGQKTRRSSPRSPPGSARGSACRDALGEVSERFVDLVDQDQREITRLQSRERAVDGDELTADLVDETRALRAFEALP